MSLRIAKRRAALLIAVADIAGLWPLDRVTATLSAFAEASLDRAVRYLLAVAAAAGEIVAPEGTASGLIVLGMGKLGARELNYSSDIDLIVLFDPETVRYTGRLSVQQCFARLARDLVRILDERTGDGYVFRTDLRLRPDPASTPLALSVQAALGYYESTGQNWERAALIKARPVAGDRAAGAAFLAELRPFLWRKHLDFAAIQDIHSIKRQINAHRGGSRIAIAGHNVKLGRGGIREIEFFAQTEQLIWGGRLPQLRVAATCDALRALADAERISHLIAEELIASYAFLRRVEHRLQMIDDAQTHTLPSDEAGLSPYRDISRLCHARRLHLGSPPSSDPGREALCRALRGGAQPLRSRQPRLHRRRRRSRHAARRCNASALPIPPAVAAAVRGWHHGRYRATRSQRAAKS